MLYTALLTLSSPTKAHSWFSPFLCCPCPELVYPAQRSLGSWTWFPGRLSGKTQDVRCSKQRGHRPRRYARSCVHWPHHRDRVRPYLIFAFLLSTYHHPSRLYGITTLQTFMYYRYNAKDPLILKASVSVCRDHLPHPTLNYRRAIRGLALCLGCRSMVSEIISSVHVGFQGPSANRTACERLLDSLHVGLITGAMYWYCITNFTNLMAVQKPIWCVHPSTPTHSDVFMFMRTTHQGLSPYVIHPNANLLPHNSALMPLYWDEDHDPCLRESSHRLERARGCLTSIRRT